MKVTKLSEKVQMKSINEGKDWRMNQCAKSITSRYQETSWEEQICDLEGGAKKTTWRAGRGEFSKEVYRDEK